MRYDAKTIKEYLEMIPYERREPIQKLRSALQSHLPVGFSEELQYGMIAFVVPLTTYPKGYHAKKNTPLPFISIASQKHTINLYHGGIYNDSKLKMWFVKRYQTLFGRKPNMGQSCIRFKTVDDLTIQLVEELASKMTVEDVINFYENRASLKT